MQRNNRGKGTRRNNNPRRANGSSQPMPLVASIQIDKVVRFKFSAALSNVAIVDTDLLDLFCVASTPTYAYQLAFAIKVRKMEMWVDPVAGGSLCSIEDVATGRVGGPSRIKEDTTLGVSRPAHIVWVPAAGSQQSLYLSVPQQNSYQWFELNSSGAGYLDVHLSLILQDGEAPAHVSAAVIGATAGALYIRALDSSSTKSILPVSYPTI